MKKFVAYTVVFHNSTALLCDIDFLHGTALICSIDPFDDGKFDFGDGAEYFRYISINEITDADIRMGKTDGKSLHK